jgi:hypothetical protein
LAAKQIQENPNKTKEKGLHFGGDFYRAHDTNLKATLRRSIAQVKGEIHPGALLTARQIGLAGLTLYRLLLPRWKATQRTAQDEPQ